MKSLLETAA